MEFLDFGYTTKWIKYDFIDQFILDTQIAEFNKGKDKPLEEFRSNLFDKWLSFHKKVTNKQIEQFLELALEDPAKPMAGNAVRKLFTSDIITDDQFSFIAERLPQFGDWTLKLITRETLLKRLKKEVLSVEIIDACIQYKLDFEDSRLVLKIIKETEDIDMLTVLSGNRNGKQIRKLASKKIDRIKRERHA
jgi:hypothetical protein